MRESGGIEKWQERRRGESPGDGKKDK